MFESIRDITPTMSSRAATLWSRSGLSRITAAAHDGMPVDVPVGLPLGVERLARRYTDATRHLGRPVSLDGPRLLSSRAAALGGGAAAPPRFGHSFGGAARLLQCDDGWLALSLPRPSDRASLPAWLEVAVRDDDPWEQVEQHVRSRSCSELVERAGWIDLACSIVGERTGQPVAADADGRVRRTGPLAERLRVVNLASLWAGPLCAQLLARCGADVVDVESSTRPDGARFGPRAFYRWLHAGHRNEVIDDFASPRGTARLRTLLEDADIVIEGSRPRAMHHLGIDPHQMVNDGAVRCWVSITGHGSDQAMGHRVAFGDDAAAAGGLVGWSRGAPCFLGDAIADPLTGLHAAVLALDALLDGRAAVMDVSLAATAASLSGGPRIAPLGEPGFLRLDAFDAIDTSADAIADAEHRPPPLRSQ